MVSHAHVCELLEEENSRHVCLMAILKRCSLWVPALHMGNYQKMTRSQTSLSNPAQSPRGPYAHYTCPCLVCSGTTLPIPRLGRGYKYFLLFLSESELSQELLSASCSNHFFRHLFQPLTFYQRLLAVAISLLTNVGDLIST